LIPYTFFWGAQGLGNFQRGIQLVGWWILT
jgi:hypothetical protein